MNGESKAAEFHDRSIDEFLRQYDTNPDFQERLRVWKDLSAGVVSRGTRVLDLGCGNGILAYHFAGLGASVVGIDGSDRMIRACEDRRAGNPSAEVQFRRLNLPANVPEAPFDVVVASSFLEYLDDSPEIDGWLASLVKPGGFLMFSLPNQKSFSRRVETLTWNVARRPVYRGLVRRASTVRKTADRFASLGLQMVQIRYFGHGTMLSRICRPWLGAEWSENLFAVVLRKPTSLF